MPRDSAYRTEFELTAHGIMFHHFYDDKHVRGQGAISADELVGIIDHVGRENILSADEWLDRAERRELSDNDLCLTFDDALLCQYDIAFPVLSDLGLTAFWFVYSSVFEGELETLEIYRYFRTTRFDLMDDFYQSFSEMVASEYGGEFEAALSSFDSGSYLSEFAFYTQGDRLFRYLRDELLGTVRYETIMAKMMDEAGFDSASEAKMLWMSDEHLREIHQAGHRIGLHSFSHPTRLAALNREEQNTQYRKNRAHIERVTGESVLCMSHPCNSYNDSTLEILRDMRIKMGFRSNMTEVDNPAGLEYPREDHANLLKVVDS